jgi:hypothetical protein
MRGAITSIFCFAIGALPAFAQSDRGKAATPDLTGVYQAIPNDATLAGGRKNQGSPGEVSLLPAAAQQMKSIDLKTDPARMCVPIGPFRMMAKDRNKIELAATPGMIVMLFEDVAHGVMRTIHLDRGHPEKTELLWFGDSVGKWEADTLVVDTIGFNDQTWLNDQGAQHSDALHLVERIRPVSSGKYLEYRMTADDPKALVRPYTYTRYYEKTNTEITDYACREPE